MEQIEYLKLREKVVLRQFERAQAAQQEIFRLHPDKLPLESQIQVSQYVVARDLLLGELQVLRAEIQVFEAGSKPGFKV